jgi:hypothetical protein
LSTRVSCSPTAMSLKGREVKIRIRSPSVTVGVS